MFRACSHVYMFVCDECVCSFLLEYACARGCHYPTETNARFFSAPRGDRFSGVMFDVSASSTQPIEFVQIDSIWVRGALGPVSIYVTKKPQSFHVANTDPEAWRMVYGTVTHEASFDSYTELPLAEPLQLAGGQRCALFVGGVGVYA